MRGVADEAVKTRIAMEVVETGIDPEIRNPARSLLHSTREPLEGVVVVTEGRMDDAEFVREQAFVRSHPLKIFSNAERFVAILQGGEGMTQPG